MSVGGKTAVYGILGHPVGHSLSPVMHNAAFARAGVDAVYVAFDVAAEDLGAALRGAHALGVKGLSVTIPHKERVLALCDSADRVAGEVGAANMLRRTQGGWEGFNTDAPACLSLLEAAGVAPGQGALVLGAGGAARAAAWALSRLGCTVTVAARRLDAAVALCQHLLAMRPGEAPRAQALGWGDVAAAARAAHVVVNATPLGLAGRGELPALAFSASQVALDFVYGDSAFARAAEEAGATVLRGEPILVRQGALAFALWTGKAAPEQVMRDAVAKESR